MELWVPKIKFPEPTIIQTLRAFRRCGEGRCDQRAQIRKACSRRRPSTRTWRPKARPRGQLGGQKRAQESNLEVKIRPWRPTWRPKADPGDQLGGPGGQGSQLGGPGLTLEGNLEAQVANETNLEGQGPPRRPTWTLKGPSGGRLGRPKAAQDANLEPKWSEKSSQREPRGSKNEAREPT